jgi:hypothetical protein
VVLTRNRQGTIASQGPENHDGNNPRASLSLVKRLDLAAAFHAHDH